MISPKERILRIALDLFSRDGYETVSVSALYKHYKNKRDIFGCILERMSQMDVERAKQPHVNYSCYQMVEG